MIYLFIAFFLTVLLGVPIAFCLGIAALAFPLITGKEALIIIPTLMFGGLDSFYLTAIPFFILAGDLAEKTGILPNLIKLAQSMVGHFRAGLAHVCIVTEMLLSGVTGTAVGDAAAIGSAFIPSMVRAGYDRKFVAVLTGAASIMGPLIPPSVPMLIYAFIQGGTVSVAALFLAGTVPGVLVGVGLMGICYVTAKVRNYPLSSEKFQIRNVCRSFFSSVPGLMVIVIMLGGILAGVFTPTEAGAACVFYLLLWGTLITRKLTFSSIVSSLRQTAITSSVVLILMANAKIVAWLLTTALIPQKCGAFLMSFSTSPYFFLTLVVFFLVFLGFFIEAIAIMIMFVPVLAPIASSYGISPTHFGLIFVMAIQIALITPPVALALFVTTRIAGIGLEDVFMEMIPFLCLITIITLAIVYFPALSLWLPRLFGYT